MWEFENVRWWCRPLIVVFLCGIQLATWGISKHLKINPDTPSLFVALLLALASSVIFVYAIPSLYRFLPSYILITDDAVMRVVGNVRQDWRFSHIAACSWQDCKEYHVMVLNMKSGGRVLVGVPCDARDADLESYLADHCLNGSKPTGTVDAGRMNSDKSAKSLTHPTN
jgi:hypothetical protein